MRRSQLFTGLKRWFLNTDSSSQRLVRVTSGLVILIGCLVLLGWALDLPLLKTMSLPGGGNMRANAALGLVLGGCSLRLSARKRLNRRTIRVAKACTLIMGAIGLLTLLQYVTGWNFGIDELLFPDPVPNPPLYPGRMSLTSAVNLGLASVAIWLSSGLESPLDCAARAQFLRIGVAQILAAIVGMIALQALVVRAYGLPFASLLGSYTTAMGAHTACAFGLLGIGVLALQSDRGWMQTITSDEIGGIVARRFIPIAILLPLGLGWLILQGQRANWYLPGYGMVLMAIALVGLLIVLIVQSAGRLNRIDSDRKRSSEQLRSSEERLNLAQIVTNTGTWEWNYQTGQAFWSERCYPLFGVSPSDPNFGMTWISRIDPEDLPQVQRVMQECATTGMIEIEYRYHHSERGLRWIYSRAAAAENFAIMRGISFDITDRKQAELERAQNQQTILQQFAEIEAIYHTAPIGLVVLDCDLRFVRLNQRLAELNGLPIDAHLGRTVREIVPNLADQVEPLFRRVLETGEPLLNLEVTGETAAQPGVQRTWIENWYPLKDPTGRTIGINAVVQEITHRKQTELALRDREQQLQQLSDAMPQFVWMANAQGVVEYVNQRWCDYSGLPLEQSRDPSRLIQYHHPDERQAVSEQWAIALETKQPFEFEGRLRSPAGDYRWFLIRAVPILDQQQTVQRWYGTSTDIHDRKLAELNDQFLTDLDCRLQQLDDADQMPSEIVSSIGAYLNVDWALWNEIDRTTQQMIIHRDWRREGLPRHAEVCSLDDLLSATQQQAHAVGEPVIVRDAAAHPNRATYEQFKIGATLSIPGIHKGEWKVLLTVNTTTARNWRQDEIRLIQAAIARFWPLIEQSRALAALRESEARFRTLADNISQFVWTTDASGWITWYNQRWFDYTGTTLAEMQGWGWQKVHHPDHVDRVVAHIRHCFETGEIWEDTFPLRGQDGQYRWFLSRAIPIRDEQGNIRRWFGTNTDITERKQAEADLEERNHYIQLLYETTRDLLSTDQPLSLVDSLFNKLKPLIGLDTYLNYMLDHDQQQLHLEFYGGITEAVARSIESLEVGQAICGLVVEQRCQIVQSDLQQTTDLPTQLLRNLGLTAYSCQPLIAQGHLFGTLGFGSRSRTSFTTAEIRLFQAICDQIAIALERASLVSSLRQQTEELTHLNRLKDEFLAALSHELRTPLNPILGWTQMIKAQRLTPEKTAEALEIIERNTKQQISLVNDLLDVSRVIQGKLNLTLQVINLLTIVQQAIETVRFTAQAKQLQIQIQGEAALPVMGDGDRLQQVFWNLLFNAIKFTPEGGQITVYLSRATNEHSVPYAQAQVIDNGIGIQADFLPHVFEHFRQADGSNTRKYGGLGLGLAIVRHLVELHGGTVGVESAGTGQGSTFTVRLPLQIGSAATISATPTEATPTEAAPQSASATALDRQLDLPQTQLPTVEAPPVAVPTNALSGLQILLIDDDRDNLDLLCFLLQEHGGTVIAFTSAIDALKFISTHSPDAIISDIGMPQINGYDFIQQVKAFPTACQIPALALTAFSQPKDQDTALQAGFDAYITKPVDPLELLSIVIDLIGNSVE